MSTWKRGMQGIQGTELELEEEEDFHLCLHALKTPGAPILKIILWLFLSEDLLDLGLFLHLLILVLLVLLAGHGRVGRLARAPRLLLWHHGVPEPWQGEEGDMEVGN